MSVTDGVDADRRPVHKKRRARTKSSTRRFDGAIRSTFFWASMAIVVLGILPIVVNAVAGLAMGTIPDGDVLGKGVATFGVAAVATSSDLRAVRSRRHRRSGRRGPSMRRADAAT